VTRPAATQTSAGRNDIAVVWPGKSAAPIIMAIYTTRAAGEAADDKAVARAATILARGLGRL
jgi:beta-lactamase class A